MTSGLAISFATIISHPNKSGRCPFTRRDTFPPSKWWLFAWLEQDVFKTIQIKVSENSRPIGSTRLNQEAYLVHNGLIWPIHIKVLSNHSIPLLNNLYKHQCPSSNSSSAIFSTRQQRIVKTPEHWINYRLSIQHSLNRKWLTSLNSGHCPF